MNNEAYVYLYSVSTYMQYFHTVLYVSRLHNDVLRRDFPPIIQYSNGTEKYLLYQRFVTQI